MPRPRRMRRVEFEPGVTYFKPRGIPLADLDESVLKVDELEAIRLKDFEGVEQIDAAKRMKISQPTFHRLLLSARKKLAEAIVKGKAIKIQGGDYRMVRPRGMGLRAGRGFGAPPSACKCPSCGSIQKKILGAPCRSMKCEKCGSVMIRND